MTSMKNVQFLHPPIPSSLFLSVRMGPNWVKTPPTPGRQNLGYQPPPPTIPPVPISFGVLTAYQLYLVDMQVQLKTLYN